jgi:hypothetical protein
MSIRVALATITLAPLPALAQTAPTASASPTPILPAALPQLTGHAVRRPDSSAAILAERNAGKAAALDITGLEAATASTLDPNRIVSITCDGQREAWVIVTGAPGMVKLPEQPAPAVDTGGASLLVFRDADRAIFRNTHPLLTPDFQWAIRPLDANAAGTAQPASPTAAPANPASAGGRQR